MKSALLLSGGMDSVAIAFWQRPHVAITIDYGQLPAQAEIRAAAAVCASLNIEHHIIQSNLHSLGSGDLAGLPALAVARVQEWWPYRNQMLVTLAAMKAIALEVSLLLIGTLKTDCAHCDGTLTFVRGLDSLLRNQEGGMRLEAPAVHLTAVELIRISKVPTEILGWAHSCHTSNFACGICRGCRKHYETMAGVGLEPY